MVGSSSLQQSARWGRGAAARGRPRPRAPASPLTAQLGLPAWLRAGLLPESGFFRLLGLFAFTLLTRDPEKKDEVRSGTRDLGDMGLIFLPRSPPPWGKPASGSILTAPQWDLGHHGQSGPQEGQ